jgi:branched-chain amino acid transport system permease protein
VRFAQGYYLIAYAFLVMVLLIVSPTGLIGLGEKLLARLPRPKAAA